MKIEGLLFDGAVNTPSIYRGVSAPAIPEQWRPSQRYAMWRLDSCAQYSGRYHFCEHELTSFVCYCFCSSAFLYEEKTATSLTE